MAWTSNQYAYDNVYVSFGGNASSTNVGDFKFFHQAFNNGSAFVSKFNCISTLRPNGSVNPFPLFLEVEEFRIQALVTTVNGSGVIVPGTGDKGLIWEYTGVGNSKIELYANDSVKLTTKSDGVLINGELESTTLDVNGQAKINGNLDVNTGTTNNVAIFESTDDNANIRIKDDDTDTYLISKDNKFSIGETGSDVDNFKLDISSGDLDIAGNLTIDTIGTLGSAASIFLTASSGTVKSRTAAEVRSDIGAGIGSVTSVGLSHTGNAFSVGSSPVTVSGTIAIDVVGSGTQYITGDGNLETFPTIPAAANNGTITIAGADGIRVNNGASGNFTTDQSANETITVTMDYAGTDNFILGSVNAAGTAIQATDKIIYSDVTTNDINFGNVSDLPFDNSGGTMSSWILDADSGGTNTISNGETVDIAGGSNITTTLSSNTVTITNDLLNNNQLVNGAGYTTNTGTVTGSGTSGRVAYWNGGSSITSDAGFTFNGGTNALTITGVMNWSGGNSTDANSAYDNMVTGFGNSGSVTKTLTLTQQDGGTLTTSFTIPQGTVTSVGISHTGNAFAVGGTPIASSGTLTVDMQGTAAQYINGAGNLITFPNIPSSAQNPTITLTAGTGLSGGGSFTLNQSSASTINFDNTGVTSIATTNGITGGTISTTGTIQLDSTVIRTTGVQTKAGSLTLSDDFTVNADTVLNGELNMEAGTDVLLSATATLQIDGDSGVGKFLKSVSGGLEWTTVTAGSGSVTSVSAANPTTGGAVGSPLFISGTSTVNPTVNFVQANIKATNVSTAVDGGVTKGTWNSNTQLDKTGSSDFTAQGEIVYFGSGAGMAQGKLYVYSGGDWIASDADAVSTSQGLIAIALGTSASAGMLTRGMYTLSYNPAQGDGDILYLSPTQGQMYYEPPSGSQDVVRILATALSSSTGEIFFHPDNTFIELT